MEIADLLRDVDGQWRRGRFFLCTTLQELPDGGDMERVSGEGLGHRTLDRRGAPSVHQTKHRGDGAAKVVPASGCSLKQCCAGRDRVMQAIQPTPLSGFALGLGEPLKVLAELDLCPLVEAAFVNGDPLISIEDLDPPRGRSNAQRSANAIVGDAVVVLCVVFAYANWRHRQALSAPLPSPPCSLDNFA